VRLSALHPPLIGVYAERKKEKRGRERKEREKRESLMAD
jgi:hypothetical protein